MKLALLELQHIQKSFPQQQNSLLVLRDISAQFRQGMSYAIMGASGTGKSTLMHMLAGLDMPTKGEILFNEGNIVHFSDTERVNFLQKSVGLLFQQPYLIKELTVIENVRLPGLIAGMPPAVCLEQARELINAVNLWHKSNNKPGELSGGQQQRIALARALMGKPAFLLADEPTGNLDEKTSREIVQLMLSLQEKWRMGIIVTTHDNYLAQAMGHILHLKNGILK